VAFNSQATPAAVQALVRRLGFHNAGDNPTATLRRVSVVVSDGDGATSVAALRPVAVTPVNDDPTINSFGSSVTWREGFAPALVSATAVLTDPDNPTLGGGELRISLDETATLQDLLAIRHVGAGAGQIGVSGTEIRYGNVAFATFTGGTAGSDLIVSFQSTASLAAVQALIRNITFQVLGDVTANSSRRLRLSLFDGAGGMAEAKTLLSVMMA
jgi:hypothetical protein